MVNHSLTYNVMYVCVVYTLEIYSILAILRDFA